MEIHFFQKIKFLISIEMKKQPLSIQQNLDDMEENRWQKRIPHPKKHRKRSQTSIVYFNFFFLQTSVIIRHDAKLIGQGVAVGISPARKGTFLFVKKVLLSYHFLFVFVILLSKKSISLLFSGKKVFARKSLYDFYSGKKSLMDGSLSWGAVDLRCAVMREQSTLRCTLIEWLLFSMDIVS